MSPLDFTIRHAVPQDCNALLGLITEHARFEQADATLTAGELQAILASDAPPVTILVAVTGSDLVGYAAITFDFALWRARRWAHLDCLFLSDGDRGQGLGATLLGAAADHALACGADRMEWQTPAWNERAIAFYRRSGSIGSAKIRFTLSTGRPASDSA